MTTIRGALVALASVLALGLAACGGPSQDETDRAVAAAKIAYANARAKGTDLAAGPCIAERLPGLENWVVDVAHDPRQKVDDDPANQCRRARDGDADHFVELTPQGKLIRTG